MRISVLIIEDHPLFRLALTDLVAQSSQGVWDISSMASYAEAEAWVNGGGRASVVLLDRHLGKADGLNLVPIFKAAGMGVIIISADEEDAEIRDAMERGVDGYLMKSASPCQIFQAVNSVLGGERVFPAGAMARIIKSKKDSASLPKLSTRDLSILEYLAMGMNNIEIANQIGISHFTVRNAMSRIMHRFNTTNRVSLLKVVLENGIVRQGAGSGLSAAKPHNIQ
jgi:two-component system nitrate/nitrite response regulator NarL